MASVSSRQSSCSQLFPSVFKQSGCRPVWDVDQYENFCRVKLMLHHPHRDQNELKIVEGDTFETFAEAFEYCQEIHPNAHPDDYYGDLAPPPEPEFEEEPDAAAGDITEEEWQELAQQLPNRDLETEDVDLLGNRPVDQAYNWNDHIGRYPDLLLSRHDYWKQLKAEHTTHSEGIGPVAPILQLLACTARHSRPPAAIGLPQLVVNLPHQGFCRQIKQIKVFDYLARPRACLKASL